MSVYYIDPHFGNDSADGLSAATAKRDYRKLSVVPGDTIAFKRGSFYRDTLDMIGGVAGIPVTYTAYGEGPLPVFCGSVDVSGADCWEEIRPHIWRCKICTPGDVGNFVFNDNECTAALCWTQEELCRQGDFWDSRFGAGNQQSGAEKQNQPADQGLLLLWSQQNPAICYRHIEAVPYGPRIMGLLKSHLIIENIRIINSGVHGLGGYEGARDVTVRNCVFENIGGCTWNREMKIRFGNAVEFWIYAEDILIENNLFRNIYDSCVTHQGPGEETVPARNFICRNNRFDTYGMAAFEYRDQLPAASAFTGNICLNAGCGFAMLGEELPRYSEIWPQPMGHHLFFWRIDHGSPEGSLEISGNTFGPAPVGAAIYSIISPEAEAQIKLHHNRYQEGSPLLVRFGGRNFSSLDEYQKATGRDLDSTVL